ncbi:putative rmlC-like cupin domain superfamily, rmlC-like jelly roll protein [Helianthus annuus]|nr:putative rmlC-like cupin domain superfamily, rmlC-like jelly roll protein [Helianthus annuus]
MRLHSFSLCLAYFVASIFIYFPHATIAVRGGGHGPVPVSDGPIVKKDKRWPLVSSGFGEISAVKIRDGNGSYYLQFITLNPRALFLPVYLHSDMLFYVNSGNGSLSWMNVEKDKLQQMVLHRGDVFRLSSETVFYIQNNVVQSYGYQPKKLEIYAIFPGSEVDLQTEEQLAGVYTAVNDLVLGFDDIVLQSTFRAPEELIEELRAGRERQPLIVDGQPQACTSTWDIGSWGIRATLGTMSNDIFNVENSMKAYNIFKEDHDVETYFGWSVTVTSKESDALKHTKFGVFMVNLTKGSMMGPHWNPNTAEVAIVLQGEGMIQVVCPGIASETECKNSRLKVEEGDVFVVPRYHPMAQISFNNNTFVFMGFKLAEKDERPQFLRGKYSLLQKLDRNVLQKSFNVKKTTIEWILSNKKEKIISECISCAEEEAAREEGGGDGALPPEEGGGGGVMPPEEGGGSGGGIQVY